MDVKCFYFRSLKLSIAFFCIIVHGISAQSVGVVLSGGGARGLAHIGVLKALEENNIPIDYLVGTSAGALVGSFYVSGYSVQEMEEMVKSKYFLTMFSGKSEKRFEYYNIKPENDASILKYSFSNKISIRKAIPLNIVNSSILDFEFMAMFSGASELAKCNFDSLFIPYRCTSTNLDKKRSETLREGTLNESVRASITFPGYIKPIRFNSGDLMVDGGITNYFPIDIMDKDFNPDIVIGIKISDSLNSSYEEDALLQMKQIKNIIINQNTSFVEDSNIVVSPVVSIGTFDFDEAKTAIQEGYDATMKSMDEIKQKISRRISNDSLNSRRKIFRTKAYQLNKKINLITIEGVSYNQAEYIKNVLIGKNEIDFQTLRKRFFKLLADEKIKSLYPLATYDPVSKKYKIKIEVTPQKPFVIKLGGVFSSRPINTSYFGLEYLKLGIIGLKIDTDIYFGKYYNSSGIGIQTDFNTKIPFYIKGYGVLNSWNYFRGFTTFLNAVSHSYVMQKESFYGCELGVPIGRQFKLTLSSSIGANEDSYYQTDNFSTNDTADITSFHANVTSLKLSSSTLNRKRYSSEGRLIGVSCKYIAGREDYHSGSTASTVENRLNISHYDFRLEAHYEQYIKLYKNIKFGLEVEGVNSWRNQFFGNYTSTILNAPIYQPFPETKTHFFRDYVSYSYLGLGVKIVRSVGRNIDFVGEAYLYRPSVIIYRTNQNTANYNYNITSLDYRYLTTAKMVFHSPIGPLTFAANYYEGQVSPWFFSLNYGYVFFNKRFAK